MANITRKIGLSLGADLCWPISYEALLDRLDLKIPVDGDTLDFEVERVTIEPFDIRQPCKYDLVIDRVTHWYHPSREWIKKAVIMDDLYVLNNPWSIQSMEKQTSYCAMAHLGLPVPETWVIPPREYEESADLKTTLERYAKLFDITEIGRGMGYPLFMKPYDGGAWKGVNKIDDDESLRKAYESSGKMLMHLQEAILPHDLFVRCVAVGPQVNVIKYDPSAPLHGRYVVAFNVVDGDEWSLLSDMTLTINSYFGWDFNSCEALRQDGVFYPIDFANACPDSQVTSLHFYFPWLVKSMLKWTIFCAATGKKMRRTVDWEPFYQIREEVDDYRERLRRYAAIAHERLETERFQEFCDQHLSHMDEVAYEFFGSDLARQAVYSKVAALYPEHEIDQFTEHFWGLIQFWRKTEADRMGWTSTGGSDDEAAQEE